MDRLLQDIRYGAKLLLKDRSFTVAALLTLTLCIGANSAIFSVMHSVLLKPLPFPESQSLVSLYNAYPKAGIPRASNGVPDYYDRLGLKNVFDNLALYQSNGVTIGEQGSPERVAALRVTPGFFQLLHVAAQAGRTFAESDGEVGSDKVAVISWSLWQQTLAGRPDAVGEDIRVNGTPYRIIGIMPRGFLFEDRDTRLWTPLAFTARDRSNERRHSNSYSMIGRLHAGVPVAQAQQQIDALNVRNLEIMPELKQLIINAGFHTVVMDYRNDLTHDVAGTLVLLQTGVLLVLLIGCVNIANLMLVRSTVRARELATRAALGASMPRLARQLLTESVLLSFTGGVLGLVAGWFGMRLLNMLGADQLPRSAEITMDWQVILATCGLAVLAGLLFGTIPAARLFRQNLSSVFRQAGRTGTSGRGALAARSTLVVVQVSVAFALLIGAGLMISSFARRLAVDPGFRRDGVLTAALALPVTRYPDGPARAAFVKQALESIRAIPGVRSAGATSAIPFGDDFNSSVITPEGYVMKPGESPISPYHTAITPGYFETMGIQLVRGRTFNDGDDQKTLKVALIDEWLASHFWPGQDPIGKRMFQGVYGLQPEDSIEFQTIVGIVRDVRVANLAGDETKGHNYVPMTQEPAGNLFVVVHTAGPPAAVLPAMRTAVGRLDPDMPVYNVRTMGERVTRSLLEDRARMVLLGLFGAVALFLAATGIYGVLAYSVTLRTKEFGIRLALGSNLPDLFRIVLVQGVRLLAFGLAIGLTASFLLTRLVQSMLFGVRPHDPLVFAGVSLLLGLVALLACALPARRATLVNPGRALTLD